MPGKATVAVLGAGSIGCYVGGALQAAGAQVLFIGRERMKSRLARSGLALSDWRGNSLRLEAPAIHFETDPQALATAALVLVCVKSGDTEAAAAAIARHASPEALVLSLQNGVGNEEVLRRQLAQKVLAGMVPFNVVQVQDRFHRGTEGELTVEASPQLAPWLDRFQQAGLPLQQRQDFRAVQWGKLLLNLNNGVNALSDLPLKAQLSERGWRACTALLMQEALSVLKQAGIAPARVGRVAPGLMPTLLRLPDWLFARVAGASLRIDPQARSSTWEDLQAGRRTEADFLYGAVLRLAAQHGMQAPANARMLELLRAAETGGRRRFQSQDLLRALQAP